MDLKAWGWDDGWSDVWAESVPDAESVDDVVAGRVTTQERTRWTVETASGPKEARVVSEQASGRIAAVGDWVAVRPGPSLEDPWSIEGTLPRRSKFSRRAAGNRAEEQVVAANVDVVWIVHGLDVIPNARRVERYLAVAWESGAQPEIVLTKADIAVDLAESRRIVEGLAFGVPVHVVSVTGHSEEQADGAVAIASLSDRVSPGRAVALLGPSGVGKSSLINRLAGQDLLETGDVRTGDKKGRHTTTRRQLVRIESGALLLDTPGMRELQVWDLDEGLGQTFPEIDEFAAQCRFRDCVHESEPGCAVLAAVEAGSLNGERLDSYRKLLAEAEYQRLKADPRAKAEQLAKWKSIIKSLKHHPKYQARK
jgi:ribosome biogenesis GTPase